MESGEDEAAQTVLVLAPGGRDGSVVAGILAQAGHRCEICADLTTLMARLDSAATAVIAEEAFASSRDMQALVQWIEAQPPWSDFPFVLLTIRQDGTKTRSPAIAEQLGNVTLLERPLRAVTLTSAVRSAVRARRRQRVAADVVEQLRQAEAHQRESEARFRYMADSAPALIWMSDAQGDITFVNRHYEHMFGRPAAAMLGQGWNAIVVPEHVAAFNAIFQRAFDARQPFRAEIRVRDKEGRIRWLRCEGVARLDDHGNFLGYTGCNVDITDAKLTAEALEARVAERSAERDRIWRLSGDMLGVAGPDGRFRAVNPAWERILGYPSELILTTSLTDLLHPDDLERTKAEVARQATGERTQNFENRYRHADGSYRWLEWSAVPAEGSIYTIAKDVTERKKLEEQLRQAQRMEAIGQLTGGVAHDFNNLLMVISSGLGLLEKTDDPARRKRLKEAMRQAVDRGAGLTRQLLAFSRRQALRPELIDVARQVEGMGEILDRSLREDIQVEMRFSPDLWPVEVDPGELELAVLNLAVNARDAMPDGGVITIRAENEGGIRDRELIGDFVRLSVQDTGTGMAPDVLKRVFEPFFTTKDVGKGSGLGLSQIYGFARQSGGTVQIESAVGQGTTVSLLLPRSMKELKSDPSQAEPAAVTAAEASYSVLLVEDDDDVAAMVSDMLEQLGYRVARVSSAPAALGALSNGREVDLVFSDVVMPGKMNGLELAREIQRRRPDLPVILTTGYSDSADALAESAVPVLRKPYRLEELAELLQDSLSAERRARPGQYEGRPAPGSDPQRR